MKTVAYVFLLILVLLSLALNGIILVGLNTIREAAVEMVDQTLATLDTLEAETLETTIHVRETIPVQANVPFYRELKVPVQTTVPIYHELRLEETFQVPIDTALLKMNIDVPVSATIPLSLSVPVDLQAPVTISENLTVDTQVEIALDVPVAIPLSQTPLPDYLEQARDMLSHLRKELSLEEGSKLRIWP